ncbi:MAG: biopolymer transporter ExbD [Planctomycetales bacterium]|nr:biopolymer transporter ExbD [Planctomycetales bacterium]
MRVPTQRSRRLGINLTPMIDVVFQLIIFFLVSSHLARQEANVPLELPRADTGETLDDDQQSRITINMTDDGQMSVAGNPLTIDQLPTLLDDAVRVKGEDLEVRIRASRDMPYRFAEKLMLECTKHQIWNVTYSVYRREEATP